jgi:hypothetical protein
MILVKKRVLRFRDRTKKVNCKRGVKRKECLRATRIGFFSLSSYYSLPATFYIMAALLTSSGTILGCGVSRTRTAVRFPASAVVRPVNPQVNCGPRGRAKARRLYEHSIECFSMEWTPLVETCCGFPPHAVTAERMAFTDKLAQLISAARWDMEVSNYCHVAWPRV